MGSGRDDEVEPALEAGEAAVLRQLSEGCTVESVARRLGMSERTVRRRLRVLCDRIGVATPIEAVVWAVRRGLL